MQGPTIVLLLGHPVVAARISEFAPVGIEKVRRRDRSYGRSERHPLTARYNVHSS